MDLLNDKYLLNVINKQKTNTNEILDYNNNIITLYISSSIINSDRWMQFT